MYEICVQLTIFEDIIYLSCVKSIHRIKTMLILENFVHN